MSTPAKSYIWPVISGAPIRILTGILFLLYASFSAAGTLMDIDSLKKALANASHDSTRVSCMSKLSRQYLLKGKIDSAASYGNEAKALAEKTGDKRGLAGALNAIANIYVAQGKRDEGLVLLEQALKLQQGLEQTPSTKKVMAGTISNMGNAYIGKGDIKKALECFTQSLEIRTSINDREGMAISLSNIAVCHYFEGNYPLSIKYHLDALKLEQEDGDKMAIARTYQNTGNVYFQQFNYPDALKNYFNAIEVMKEIDDKVGMGRVYNNIGGVLVLQKKLDEALNYFSLSLTLKKGSKDLNGLGRLHLNLGNIYYLQAFQHGENTPERKALFDRALAELDTGRMILDEFGDKQGMAIAYNDIGAIHINLGKAADARAFLSKGLAFAAEVNSLEDMKASYQHLARVDSMQGRWADAYEHHKLYVLYKDSLKNEENTKKIVQAQMNFDFEQKELQAALEREKAEAELQQKIERQRLIGWSIAGIGLFAILSTILFFNRAKLKQKNQYQQQLHEQQQKQAAAVIEVQEQERKRIAEDLHDSLGHLLSTAKLNLQSVPDDQKKHYTNTLQLLDQASQEIRNISFNLMPQTLEEGGLVPALYELADKIRKSSLYDIMIQVHNMDNLEFDQQTKFNIYRIVQEAVNNILKHANAKEINIQLVKQEENLSIMIEDDGKGFNMAEVKKFGRGLKNITARSEWLHGSITIDSTPGRGTTIAIEIPLNKK